MAKKRIDLPATGDKVKIKGNGQGKVTKVGFDGYHVTKKNGKTEVRQASELKVVEEE